MTKCDRNCFSCPYADCILDYEDFDGAENETTIILFPERKPVPEDKKKAAREYYYSHREQYRVYHEKRYAENKTLILEKRRAYYQQNKEAIKAKQKQRYEAKKEGANMVVEVVTTKTIKDTRGDEVKVGEMVYFTDSKGKAYVGTYEGMGARGALVFNHIEGKGRFTMMPSSVVDMFHIEACKIRQA